MVAVKETEQTRALDTLVAAFAEDPVERWLYPEADAYHQHFPDFLVAFGGGAFQAESVWQLDSFSAVAMWMPPGVEPDGDAIVSVLRASVTPAKLADTFGVLELMDQAHPTYAHWYLPWLGVHPSAQGQGLGGRLLAQCLAMVDESSLPAYLETPNPRNVSLYERHGFESVGVAKVGGCPPITLMLRSSRS
jgi:GNAT superfamily N-acetyltransferase